MKLNKSIFIHTYYKKLKFILFSQLMVNINYYTKMDFKKKQITDKQYCELKNKWLNKKISFTTLRDALKGTKYEVKEKNKNDYNYDNYDNSECCCLNCDKCWERIREGSYSYEDWFGEDWYEEWND